MKSNPFILTIGFLLAVIVCFMLFSFQVRVSEVAVVTTFGRPGWTVTEPGIEPKLPWPVQRVYKFDKRIQNFEDKYDESLTADSYNLLAMTYIGWRISDPKAFFPKFANGSIPEAERVLEGLVRSEKSAVIGKHPLSDFVSADEKQLKFVEIEQEILKRIQDQVNARNYGISMEYLGIKKMGFPESVTQEVFKRMTSERAVLSSRIQYEGEAEATRIKSAADSQAAQMIAQADAKATEIKALGQKKAAESFAVFQQEPTLANLLLSMTALGEGLRSKTTVVLDSRTPPFQWLQNNPSSPSTINQSTMK
jgi:modulator of FtsH protease HflC